MVIKHIRENGSNKSITENAHEDANGPSKKVHLSLLLTLDGQTIESQISGNYRINRVDGKIKGTIIADKEHVDSVESLTQGGIVLYLPPRKAKPSASDSLSHPYPTKEPI